MESPIPPDAAEPTTEELADAGDIPARKALCLSGGGFRAALFHLGIARRLNEYGILSQFDTIVSVSGGSILSAHLAQAIRPWPAPGAVIPDEVWEATVAEPFRAFTRRDLRTGPLKHWLLRPWNWWRPDVAVMALARRYARDLTSLRLDELPPRPRFVFTATDLTFGVNWTFTRDRVGDYRAGFGAPKNITVAQAVAASSCFPPVFFPMQIRRLNLGPADLKGGEATNRSRHTEKQVARRDDLVRHLILNDGGNYDNLGLEPVWPPRPVGGSVPVIFVSDGGATFDFDSSRRFYHLLLRYPSVVMNQVIALRRTALFAAHARGSVQGTYVGIGSAPERYAGGTVQRETVVGYSKALAADVIAEIRTDMNAFSEAEICVLENHGYTLADAAVQRWLPDLPSVPGLVPLRIPHPDWMNEADVQAALARSRDRALIVQRGTAAGA